MIYVSSNCSKKNNIKEAVLDLVSYGIKNIELSGGTNFYPEYLNDLSELKHKHNLNYRLHNYFPPPEKHFVLNLASANKLVLEQSRDILKKSIDLSSLFSSEKYGLHAGFRISPKVDELGKKIQAKELLPYEEALDSFAIEVNKAQSYAEEKGVQLYLENNVFSLANKESFNSQNPFFLTNSEELFELKKKCKFKFLLDVAHLKVSCQTLSLSFENEFHKLINETDYVHISNNDGTCDSNKVLKKDTDVFNLLKESNLKNKTFTVEVYDGHEEVLETIDLLHQLVN